MKKSIDKLALINIVHYYHSNEIVFNEVSLELPAQKVVYLKGPRGSGKSTLMKILLGLVEPVSGDYLINNQLMNELSHNEFDQYRMKMGFSFDVGGLINNLSLYENYKLLLDYHNYLEPDKRHDYIVELLKVFDLDELKHLRPALVSSSARKAASVLRAFLLKPELIILNDPTQGLSPEHIVPLVNLIEKERSLGNLKFLVISSDDQNLIDKCPGLFLTVKSHELSFTPNEDQCFKGAA